MVAGAGGGLCTDAATTDGPLLLLLTAALRRACCEGSTAVAPAAASSAAACGRGNSMAAAGRGVEGVRQLRCLLAVCLVAHHCLRRLHAMTAGPAAASAAAPATITVPCGLLRIVRGGSGDAEQPPACSAGASCGTPPGPRGGDDALGDVPEGGGRCTGEVAVPVAALLGDALYCLENLLCSWQDDVLQAVATGSGTGTGTHTPTCSRALYLYAGLD